MRSMLRLASFGGDWNELQPDSAAAAHSPLDVPSPGGTDTPPSNARSLRAHTSPRRDDTMMHRYIDASFASVQESRVSIRLPQSAPDDGGAHERQRRRWSAAALTVPLSLTLCLSLSHTVPLSLSLCLSLSHCAPLSHTVPLSLSHCASLSLTVPLSLTLCLSLSHTVPLSLSLCLSLSHTLCLSLSHTVPLSLSLSLSHCASLSLTLCLSLSLTVPLSLSLCLSLSHCASLSLTVQLYVENHGRDGHRRAQVEAQLKGARRRASQALRCDDDTAAAEHTIIPPGAVQAALEQEALRDSLGARQPGPRGGGELAGVSLGSSLGDAKSSLGDAKSTLGDAKSSLGDAESSLGDATSSLGDAES
jgi:hypothetical protein